MLFLARVSYRLSVEVLLETGEDLADLFGAAEVGDGVGDGVVVFEAQQGVSLLWSSSSTPTVT